MKIRKFFRSKKLVYASWKRKVLIGELVKIFSSNGKRYVRIAFTNKIKYKGTIPVTDVPYRNVFLMKKLPSPFKIWRYKMMGKVALTKFQTINKK